MVLRKKTIAGVLSLFAMLGCTLSDPSPITFNKKTEHISLHYNIGAEEGEHWGSKLESIVASEPGIKEYLPLIIAAVDKYDFPIDKQDAALVVAALVYAETIQYDKYAISSAGAAGIVQFIPETAIGKFGLKAYLPDYVVTARSDLQKAYAHYRQAQNSLKNLDMNSAETEMIKYLALKKKANNGFNKYKKDLLSKITDKDGKYLSSEEIGKIDERFLPSKSIDACVKFISQLLFIAEGDIRVAVSGYNAGEGRIKSYKGIPPFEETVLYQNKIYNKYKELKKVVENNDCFSLH